MTARVWPTSGAVGFLDPRARKPKVAVSFEPHQLAAINARAKANGTSFGHEVRTLVDLGLNSDAHRAAEAAE